MVFDSRGGSTSDECTVPGKEEGEMHQRLLHPSHCTDSSLNMLKLTNQLVVNWTVTAVVCNSSTGWKASYSLAGFPGVQASTTAISSKCRVGKRCTWSSCESVRAAVPMCCMCHWYKSLLWNHSLMARSVRAFLSTSRGRRLFRERPRDPPCCTLHWQAFT